MGGFEDCSSWFLSYVASTNQYCRNENDVYNKIKREFSVFTEKEEVLKELRAISDKVRDFTSASHWPAAGIAILKAARVFFQNTAAEKFSRGTKICSGPKYLFSNYSLLVYYTRILSQIPARKLLVSRIWNFGHYFCLSFIFWNSYL